MVPNPADFKNVIPGPTSNLCEKFVKLAVNFTTAVYNWVAFEYNSAGSGFTNDFKNLICALDCGGTGGGGGGDTPNPNMPAPTGVSASDGTFADKVRVTWNAVTPPTGVAAVANYYVYRASSTVTSSGGAALIATVAAGTHTYDDATAVPGTTYNYWVRATNGTDFSAYGGPDVGHAASFTTTLPAISDLRATQGFYIGPGFISIVFSLPAGVTQFDLYRHTSNDFGSATKIASDKTWQDTYELEPVLADGNCYRNLYAPLYGTSTANFQNEIVYFHDPPSDTVKYYFWVVVKRIAPPEQSAQSNAAQGWVQIGTGDTNPSAPAAISGGTIIIPGGKTQMRVTMFGGGGAGAGGSPFSGGGGGGGGDVLQALIAVTPGQVFTFSKPHVRNGSSSFGNPPAYTPLQGSSTTTAYEGRAARLDDGSGVVLTAAGGYNGMHNTAGGGDGGPSDGTVNTGVSGTSPLEIAKWIAGRGEPGQGNRGGRGGRAYGFVDTPPAHYLGSSFNGNADAAGATRGSGGGGSSAVSNFEGGSNSDPYVIYTLID